MLCSSLHLSGAVGTQPIWKSVVTVAPIGPLTACHLCGADWYLTIALFHALRTSDLLVSVRCQSPNQSFSCCVGMLIAGSLVGSKVIWMAAVWSWAVPGMRVAETAIFRSLVTWAWENPWAEAPYVATGIRLVAKSLEAFLENFPKILRRPALPWALEILLFCIVVDLLLPAVASNPRSRTVSEGLRVTLVLSFWAMSLAAWYELATIWDFTEIFSLACLSCLVSEAAD